MKFAGRVENVSPSITLGLNAKTLELRKQGKDIVSLGVGEPDIDTPQPICDAAFDAIEKRQCRYTATAGTPELRKAIACYIRKVYGLEYPDNCVMASSGAKHALYNAMLATLSPGDEIVFPTPYWTSYPEMAHLVGARPVLIETSAKDAFKLRPEALERAITPSTRALLLNSPSNPTGIVYDDRDLLALAEVLRDREIWIISDDIYSTLLFDGAKFASFASIPGFKEKTIVVNGVSKTFSMTGWRIGFSAGSREIIAAMTKMQDHSTSCPNAVAQAAARRALELGSELTQGWVDSLAHRRDLMISLVRKIPGLTVTVPQGAFYLYVDVGSYLNKSDHITTTMQLCDLMLEWGLAVVPGEAFGTNGFIRLSFAVTPELIAEGIRRMATVLEHLTGTVRG